MLAQLVQGAIDIREAVLVHYDKRKGVPLSYLLALSNLIRELGSLLPYSSIEGEWIRYRKHISLTDAFRVKPSLFPGFVEINGLGYLDEVLVSGGIVATFHYGDYRALTKEIGRRAGAKGVPVALVLDRPSFDSESSLAYGLHALQLKGLGTVEYMVAEDSNVALQLLRFIKRGGIVIIYIDGNRGSGEDSVDLEAKFVTSLIKVRSGIFRLLAMTSKPLIMAIADRTDKNVPILTFSSPYCLERNHLLEGIEFCYSHIRPLLHERPYLWRFWYRHHEQVVSWADFPARETTRQSSEWFTKADSYILRLEVATGYVYKT